MDRDHGRTVPAVRSGRKRASYLAYKPPDASLYSHSVSGVNTAFWTDYGEALEQRFNAWAAK